MSEGEEIAVDETVERPPAQTCADFRSRYRLSKREGRLVISLRVALEPEKALVSSSEFKSEIMSRTEACKPAIFAFWKRYDIDFDLQFTEERKSSDITVVVYKGEGRSNSNDFYLGEEKYCEMVVHEVGHHLGLPDEYFEEGTCRTEKAASTESCPWSAMNTTSVGWSNFEIFPRHLETILGAIWDPKDVNLVKGDRFVLRANQNFSAKPDVLGQPMFTFPDQTGSIGSRLGACVLLGREKEIRGGERFALLQYDFKRRRIDGRLGVESQWWEEGWQNLESPVHLRCVPEEPTWQSSAAILSPFFDLSPF